MNRKLLFTLLLLPSLAQAVICKTVGEDGVASYADVPAAECPQASSIPDYSRPVPLADQAGSVDTGVSARQLVFAGYESIEIVSPEADGTVRSNEGRVPVRVKLQAALQQSHFITAYLDGKAFRGRYGSGEITLAGVDPGTHELRVKVSDTKGKTLIESPVVSFTLQRSPSRITVGEVAPDKITGSFSGLGVAGSTVTIQFPISRNLYQGIVAADGTWEVGVAGEPTQELSFMVRVNAGGLEFKKAHNSGIKSYAPLAAPNYRPSPADYTPPPGGILTTPGQTNPTFNPNYNR